MATQKIEAQLQGGGTGVNIGEQIKVDFFYSTDPDSKATGFNFSAFFDSTELRLDGFAAGSAGGFVSDAPINDGTDGDGNPETDTLVNYAGQTTDFVTINFPNGTQPLALATATFTVLDGFDGAPINFLAEPGGDPNGVLFTTETVPLALTLDVDEAPVVADPIDDITVEEDDDNTTIDLLPVFSDADGDEITYTVTSSDQAKIQASIVGTNLVLDYQPDQFGNDIAITVTATANGKSVSDDFLVDITESTAPELTSSDGRTIDVGGTDGNIEYKVKQVSSSVVSDIGFYEISTDDTTGETTQGADQLILSTLGTPPAGFTNIDLSRIVSALEGDKLGFYVTTNPSGDEDAEAQTFRSTDESSRISIADVDADGVLDIQFANEDGSTAFILSSLGTEESSTADTDIQDGSAIIDLTGDTGTVNFTVDIFNQASYNNIVGVYNIDALTGENLTPGADGFDSEAYIDAALDNLTGATLVNAGDGQAVNDLALSLTGGSRYGIFVITDIDLEDDDDDDDEEEGDDTEQAIDDARNGDLEIYFPFLGANGDEAAHVKLLGDNTFGIEDLDGGGDQDFNDVILNFTRV
jgi:hypothetical protein